jgi:hypothetical protein
MNVRQANSTGFTPKTEDLLRLEKHQQKKKLSKDTTQVKAEKFRNVVLSEKSAHDIG